MSSRILIILYLYRFPLDRFEIMGTRACATTLQPEMSEEELSALANWVGGIGSNGKYLEIGTAAGGTLSFMMNCFDAGTRPRFVVVDTMAYFDNQLT